MVRQKRTWSDNDLIFAVKNSQCLGDVLDKLSLVRGGSYKSIKSHIQKLKLDITHFLSPSDLAARARKSRKGKTKEDLFIENGEYHDYKRVKEIILRENLLKYECSICKIIDWHGRKLNLQMDHINGNKRDNRLENLRLICPNCHSLTDNFCGKNRSSNSPRSQNTCIVCSEFISKNAIWCRTCSAKNKLSKIEWPEISALIEMTEKFGFAETGRKLGVSDNAIRKHIKKYTGS